MNCCIVVVYCLFIFVLFFGYVFWCSLLLSFGSSLSFGSRSFSSGFSSSRSSSLGSSSGLSRSSSGLSSSSSGEINF